MMKKFFVKYHVLASVLFYLLFSHLGYLEANTLKPLNEYEQEATKNELNAQKDRLENKINQIKEQISQLQNNSGKRSSGARNDHSRKRIVNGVFTAMWPSTGAILKGMSAEAAILECTGTLIGCNTFLTAAHCIAENPSPSNYHVFFQHGGIFSVDKIEYQTKVYQYPKGDIAILSIKGPVTGIMPAKINDQYPLSEGSKGIIVGFGRTGGEKRNWGIKQKGFVQTVNCKNEKYSSDEFICWNYDSIIGTPGEDSNTCNGDSGGPLFVEFPQYQTFIVSGITSGGRNPSCLSMDQPDFSYDSSVLQHQKWIKEVSGKELNIRTCGNIPQVLMGDSKVEVIADHGSLSQDKSEWDFEIAISPKTKLMRISMNGEHDVDNLDKTDFNLFVKYGTKPNNENFDCKQDGPGSFGFCEFKTPEQGVWHGKVTLKNGEGKFQVVGTIFH